MERDIQPGTPAYNPYYSDEESAAYNRGLAGIRPDAAAIAQAREQGRREVIAVVRAKYANESLPYLAKAPACKHAREILESILRACGETV